MVLRLVIGLGAAVAVAGRRVGGCTSSSAQAGRTVAGERTDDVGKHLGTQARGVIGQRKLLKWSASLRTSSRSASSSRSPSSP
jgi:hypothetical protein